MSDLNLSRSEAVRLHREMWNWIADELEKMALDGICTYEDVFDMKQRFCKENGYKNILHYCFCCDYDYNKVRNYSNTNLPIYECQFCPLKWGTEDKLPTGYYCQDALKEDDFKGKWSLCDRLSREAQDFDTRPEIIKQKYLEAAKLAREIAELPERDVNADFATLIAEDRGILDYKLKGNRMIYYANWKETQDKDVTYKVTIRLDTLKEERQKLNRYYEKGNINRGL